MPPIAPTPTPSFTPTPVTPPPVPTPPSVTPPPAPVTPTNIPPITPPKPPAPEHHEMRLILPALLLVLIIGAGYYWYTSRMEEAYVPVVEKPVETAATTTVPVAAAAERPKELPQGFPESLPVEKANLVESYKLEYKGRDVTQYTVAYTSTKTKDALYTTYNSYITANGYKLNTAATSKANGVLSAAKDADEINVVVSSNAKGSLVQITYVKRGE